MDPMSVWREGDAETVGRAPLLDPLPCVIRFSVTWSELSGPKLEPSHEIRSRVVAERKRLQDRAASLGEAAWWDDDPDADGLVASAQDAAAADCSETRRRRHKGPDDG